MERFLKHAERFETEIVFDHIHTAKLAETPVHARGRLRHLHLRRADHRDRRLGQVPRPRLASRRSWARASRGCATCDGFFYKGQDVCVVGGGNTAVEEALYLSNIAKHVTVVHRRDKFRAEKILSTSSCAKVAEGKVTIAAGTRRSTRCSATSRASPACASKSTKDGSDRGSSTLTGCFIAIGHKPNTDIFAGPARDEGRLHRHARAASTATPPRPACRGVFAAGDVQDHVYRQAVTSAGTAAWRRSTPRSISRAWGEEARGARRRRVSRGRRASGLAAAAAEPHRAARARRLPPIPAKRHEDERAVLEELARLDAR